MDPLTLIITALATTAANAAVQEATVDAYKRLKELIVRRFGGAHDKEAVLESFERDPMRSEEPLRQALQDSGLDRDESVLREARRLLETRDPRGAASGKYTLTVTGDVQGVVQGDHNTVRMDFGTPRKET